MNDFDADRERRTRDRALAIAADAERLRLGIESLPKRVDDMLHWRRTLHDIQLQYLDIVRNCDRNLTDR